MNQPPLPKLPQSASNEDSWVLWRNGQHVGPLTTKQVKHLLTSKQIAGSDLLWGGGRNRWEMIKTLPDFSDEKLQAPPLPIERHREIEYGKRWYWSRSNYSVNERLGPCDNEEIRQLIITGEIEQHTPVLHPDLTSNQWVMAGQVKLLASWLADAAESKRLMVQEDFPIKQDRELSRISSTRIVARDRVEPCPFPGAMVQSLLPFFKDQSNPSKPRFNASHYGLFGIAYCVVFLVFILHAFINLENAKPGFFSLVFMSFVVFLLAVVLACLHFATHWILSICRSVLQNPNYKISSDRYLHIAATPLVAIGMGCLAVGVFSLFGAMQIALEPGNLLYASGPLTLSLGFVFLIIRSVLNPAHVGVQVDSTATFAETIIGVSAVFSRAPLYSCEMIYPVSLVISVTSAALTISLHYIDYVDLAMNLFAMLSMMLIGFLGTVFPLIAFAIAFSGMLTLELLQAVFDIRRNTNPSN